MLNYKHSDLQLATRFRVEGGDALNDADGTLACALSLRPHEPRIITVDLLPVFDGKAVRAVLRQGRNVRRGRPATKARRRWLEGCAIMTAENPVVQVAWDQAVSDLASLQLLEGPSDEPYMIIAGVPNYTGLFGRDAYVTSLQTAALTPATLAGFASSREPLECDGDRRLFRFRARKGPASASARPAGPTRLDAIPALLRRPLDAWLVPVVRSEWTSPIPATSTPSAR